jgi:predicted Zn-dependent peptidase
LIKILHNGPRRITTFGRGLIWILLLVFVLLGSVVSAAPRKGKGLFEKKVLENGITVLYKTMKDQPKISMYAVIPVGTNYEESNKKGIAHLLEHLIFRGHGDYTFKDVMEVTSRQGGYFNGFTSFYTTTYNYVVPKEQFEQAFKTFNASLWEPAFESHNVEMEKQIIVHELDLSYSSRYPYYPVIRYFYPEMFHSKETLAGISASDLKAFHQNYYQPQNVTFIIAGDFEPQKVFDELAKVKNGFGAKEVPKVETKMISLPRGEVVETRNLYPFKYQVLMAYELEGLTAKERMVLKLLSFIYGMDFKVDYLKEQYKIYNVVTRTVGNKDFFGIYYLERNNPFSPEEYAKEKQNLKDYFEEFKKIDFKRAVQNLIGLILLEEIYSQATPEDVVEYEVARLTNPDNISVEAIDILKKLTPKDLESVINKYFQAEPTAWILVKDQEGGK